jgi:hypothetical protein
VLDRGAQAAARGAARFAPSCLKKLLTELCLLSIALKIGSQGISINL